jgi:Flp pilus assembly protein TadG
VAVLVALSLLVLMGFAALAIDVGYLKIARNELQTAADAAALAGARKLVPYLRPGVPNWTDGHTEAGNRISLNKAVGKTLSQATVAYGYWDVASTTQKDVQLSSAGMGTPLPAVQVTVAKNASENGGPIRTFFAGLLGIPTANSSAKAVAVISSPSSAGPGLLFPVVISKCMYDNFWNPATEQPRHTTPFKITSSYHTGPCEAGQWSSLTIDANDVNTIRDLISNRNSVPVSVGDSVWIEPGTKNTLYDNKNQPSVNGCSAAGDRSCEYVMVAVVNDVSAHSHQPVLAFACMRILNAVGGNDKYITAQMVPMGDAHCEFSGTGGVGPSYGVIQPPRLTY